MGPLLGHRLLLQVRKGVRILSGRMTPTDLHQSDHSGGWVENKLWGGKDRREEIQAIMDKSTRQCGDGRARRWGTQESGPDGRIFTPSNHFWAKKDIPKYTGTLCYGRLMVFQVLDGM